MPFIEMEPGRYVQSEQVWRIDANPDVPDGATSWPIGVYENSQDSIGTWYWYGTSEAREAALQRLLGADLVTARSHHEESFGDSVTQMMRNDAKYGVKQEIE